MAAATAEAPRQTRWTPTERIFAALWSNNGNSKNPIAESLLLLLETLDPGKTLSDRAFGIYLAVLSEMTQEQCIRAFGRAAQISSFFPRPADLRRLAGVSSAHDSADFEAMVALREIFERMREFGPELKPKPGKIIREKDKDGLVLMRPDREPDVPCPPLGRRKEAALFLMGLGSRSSGLAMLATHPVFSGVPNSGEGWIAKNAADLERQWLRAWNDAREDEQCKQAASR